MSTSGWSSSGAIPPARQPASEVVHLGRRRVALLGHGRRAAEPGARGPVTRSPCRAARWRSRPSTPDLAARRHRLGRLGELGRRAEVAGLQGQARRAAPTASAGCGPRWCADRRGGAARAPRGRRRGRRRRRRATRSPPRARSWPAGRTRPTSACVRIRSTSSAGVVEAARHPSQPHERFDGQRREGVVAGCGRLVGGRLEQRARPSAAEPGSTDERGALLDHGGQPHGVEAVGRGDPECLVRPLARERDAVEEPVRLGHVGHRPGPLLVGRHLVDRGDELVGEAGHGREVAHVEGDAHAEAERARLVGDVALGAGVGEPPVAVLGRVVEQADHGGRLGGQREQLEVVVGLAEPGLGQLQRLVGGAEPERRLRRRAAPPAPSRRSDRRPGRGGSGRRGRGCRRRAWRRGPPRAAGAAPVRAARPRSPRGRGRGGS